jgi:hypothetical protein
MRINILLLSVIIVLLMAVTVTANEAIYENPYEVNREYYYAEEKNIEFGETFDISNFGIIKFALDSGPPVEIGVDRATSEDTDCSEFTSYGGSCGMIAFDLQSALFSSSASTSFAPGKDSGVNTPYFDIVVLDMKNNKKKTDVVYSLKIIEHQPSTIFVKRNEKFELLPNQIARYGEYEVRNMGVGLNGGVYLIFMKDGKMILPDSDAFKDGKYYPIANKVTGAYSETDPIACWNNLICAYYSGYNQAIAEPKNDYYSALGGDKIYLTFSAMKKCIGGDNYCPDDCTYDTDKDCAEPVTQIVKDDKQEFYVSNGGGLITPIPMNEENNSDENIIAEENKTGEVINKIDSSDNLSYNSTSKDISKDDSKGLFKSISKFFKSLFRKK